MSHIHLAEIQQTIPAGVQLVAVSKFHPAELIQEAYDQGQRIFGESRAQELQGKVTALPNDIQWHFIGHLQPNKVKYIAPYIALIEAVDSLTLLKEINKQAAKHDRVIDCLLELHLADEATKYGFSLEACEALLSSGELEQLPHVRITGLMCMATNTDDEEQIRREFHQAWTFFDHIKATYFSSKPWFCQRSWGMSHDYRIAMEEGATLVRIGTAIFGERD